MKPLSDELKSMQDKFAKEKADLEKKHATFAIVKAALDLPDSAFKPGFMHTAYFDCHVELEAETLNDAMVMAENMNPLNLSVHRDSCVSIRPTDRLTDAQEAKSKCIGPYYYQVSANSNFHNARELRFCVAAADLIVQVRIAVKHDPLTYVSIRSENHGTAMRPVWVEVPMIVNNSGHFPNVLSWWSSDVRFKEYSLY